MTPLLLALTLAAPVPKDFQKPPLLDGKWLLVRMQHQGEERNSARTMTWAFAGDTLSLRLVNDGGRGNTLSCRVDSRATPREVDFDNGEYKYGVFEVKGDTLVICMARTRPKDFAVQHEVVKYTFERMAKDK